MEFGFYTKSYDWSTEEFDIPENTPLLVTFEKRVGKITIRRVKVAMYNGIEWNTSGVIAWCFPPKPYKGEIKWKSS